MEYHHFRIDTQFLENYGAHDNGGTEPVRPWWKFKGGDTYIVTSKSDRIENAVAFLVAHLNEGGLSHHMREFPTHWEVLTEGWEDRDDTPAQRTHITVPPYGTGQGS